MQAAMSTDKTSRKVTFASWTAGATTIVLYFLKISVIKDTPLPDPVEYALGLVVSGAISWGATWIAGRMTRPSTGDSIVVAGSNVPIVAGEAVAVTKPGDSPPQ